MDEAVKIDIPEEGGQSDFSEGTDKLTLEQLAGAAGDKSEPKPGEGTGTPKEGEGGEPPKGGKIAYTPQELEALLQSGTEVDTDRLSLEGKVLMKSFQRGLEPKFQQLADMRKRMEAESERSQDPREQVFRRYMQNPAQVVAEINTEIRKLEIVPPTDEENYIKARQTIVALGELKDEMGLRRQGVIESHRTQETTFAKAQAEILADIPDFAEKREALTDFAIGLGLSREEVLAISDPTLFGPLAVKVTKALNTLYNQANAGNSAEKKVKKDAPKPLARAGSGGRLEGEARERKPEEMSMPEYRRWREGKT